MNDLGLIVLSVMRGMDGVVGIVLLIFMIVVDDLGYVNFLFNVVVVG